MANLSEYMKNVERVKLRVIKEGYYTDGEEKYVHNFNEKWIKQIVAADIKKGNYRIGLIENGTFNVCYIGRSTDQSLVTRICQHLNMDDDHYFDDDYYFFFDAAKTDEEAIRQECLDYHSFGGDDEWLDNDYHPSMPEDEKCPWPGCGHVGE